MKKATLSGEISVFYLNRTWPLKGPVPVLSNTEVQGVKYRAGSTRKPRN